MAMRHLAEALAARRPPPSGAMLVEVQVSSMKTRRAGSTSRCRLAHCARRRATSGRSCSAAISVFFVTELLGVDELPDRAVVDLEAALGELGHEPAQGEVALPAAPDHPVAIHACDLLRLVAADLARRDAARHRNPLQPVDRRAVADAKTGRRLPTREPFLRHRRHNTLAKIHRISSTHPGWPPRPVQTVNQNRADSRIPNRFNANSSRSLGHARGASAALFLRRLGGLSNDTGRPRPLARRP